MANISTYHYFNKYVNKAGEVKLYPIVKKYEKHGSKFLDFDNNEELQLMFKDLKSVNDKKSLKLRKSEIINKLKSMDEKFTDKQLENYFYRKLKYYKV